MFQAYQSNSSCCKCRRHRSEIVASTPSLHQSLRPSHATTCPVSIHGTVRQSGSTVGGKRRTEKRASLSNMSRVRAEDSGNGDTASGPASSLITRPPNQITEGPCQARILVFPVWALQHQGIKCIKKVRACSRRLGLRSPSPGVGKKNT